MKQHLLTLKFQKHRLSKQMHNGAVTFAYEKEDGSIRKAKGTFKCVQNLIKDMGSKSFKTVCYFDLDVNRFRSFKIENFITAY